MPAYQFSIFTEDFPHTDSEVNSYSLDRSKTLHNNFMQHNIKTHSQCGGKAICGGCRIKILSGQRYCNKAVDEEKIILTEQELEEGWRLACQLYCLKDISLFIPS